MSKNLIIIRITYILFMKIKKILLIVIIITLFIGGSVYSQNHNVRDNNLFGLDPSKIYISFDISFFLPVVTINTRINLKITDRLSWGFGLNYFLVGGNSINGEVFIKYSLIHTQNYEFPVSIGFLAGGGTEASFGPTPKNFLGIGIHILLSPLVIKSNNVSVSLINIGTQLLTDFSSLSFSVYLGNGFRYYFNG